MLNPYGLRPEILPNRHPLDDGLVEAEIAACDQTLRRRSKFGNQPQNVAEQIPRDGDLGGAGMIMSQETSTPVIVAPQVPLNNHLKALKPPTFAPEYEKVTMESA